MPKKDNFFIKILSNQKRIMDQNIRVIYRVANTSESEPALFPTKKGQKPPPIFHIKKTDPPIIFIVFLCGNFSHANSKLQKIF